MKKDRVLEEKFAREAKADQEKIHEFLNSDNKRGCGSFHRAIISCNPNEPNGVCWFCNQP